MKLYLSTLATLLLAALPLQAQLIEPYSFSPSLAIPDGNGTGMSDSHIISGSAIPAIGDVQVILDISGNYNGDLYVYLRHETETSPGTFLSDGLSVLLNRPGRTLGNPSGNSDSGLQITLS